MVQCIFLNCQILGAPEYFGLQAMSKQLFNTNLRSEIETKFFENWLFFLTGRFNCENKFYLEVEGLVAVENEDEATELKTKQNKANT